MTDPESQPLPIYFGLIEVLADVFGPAIYQVKAQHLPAWVRVRLAAAAVPRAASPADHWEQRARQTLWLGHGCFGAGIYGDDGEMQCNNTNRHRPLDFKRESWNALKDELLYAMTLRATGEGARDAVTGLPAVPVPPGAAAEESPAVAVSLDPYRLRQLHMRLNVEMARRGVQAPACDGPDCEICEVLARLRGEAAVRSTTGTSYCCARCSVAFSHIPATMTYVFCSPACFHQWRAAVRVELCTCSVVTGGHIAASPACPVHRPAASRPPG